MTAVRDHLLPNDLDLLLWDSLKAGNRGAFEQLLKKYYSTLFRYASRFSKNRASVEDCLQDVFVYIWEHRAGLGRPANVKFYLFKSIRNRMFLELKERTIPIVGNAEIFFEEDTEKHIISREIENHNRQKLSLLLRDLPERQKEALYLKYFEELKVDEIGEMMGVSRQSAANFLYRALTTLREGWYEKTFSFFLALCMI